MRARQIRRKFASQPNELARKFGELEQLFNHFAFINCSALILLKMMRPETRRERREIK